MTEPCGTPLRPTRPPLAPVTLGAANSGAGQQHSADAPHTPAHTPVQVADENTPAHPSGPTLAQQQQNRERVAARGRERRAEERARRQAEAEDKHLEAFSEFIVINLLINENT